MSSRSHGLLRRVIGSEDPAVSLSKVITLGSVGAAIALIPSTLFVVLATYSGAPTLDALVVINGVALLWLVVVLFGPSILDWCFEE